MYQSLLRLSFWFVLLWFCRCFREALCESALWRLLEAGFPGYQHLTTTTKNEDGISYPDITHNPPPSISPQFISPLPCTKFYSLTHSAHHAKPGLSPGHCTYE